MNLNNVIVFDGVCNFCSGAIPFIIKRDRNAVFRFTPLQSNLGRRILQEHGFDPDDVRTFLLTKNGRCFDRSDAALEMIREFSWIWQLLRILRLLPKFFRDWFYNRLADNRYRWFGRKESCMIPGDEIKSRFLNDQ